MRVLHLRATNFYGGPERQLHRHAATAPKHGVVVVIGSFTEKGRCPEMLEVIASDGLPTHLFEVRNAYDVGAIPAIRDYLASRDIDLLCTHDYRTNTIGFAVSRFSKRPWVAFSRGWTQENLKLALFQTVDKTIIRFADHIVAVAQSQKRRLVRLLVPAGKITVVHNAIDSDAVTAVEPENLRRRFGFPPDCVIAVAGGRFSAEKGQLDLVQAGIVAAGKNDRLRLVLYGDGPDLAAARRLVNKSGCEDRIVLPGFERNLIAHLRGADLLVNPSHSEGLPNIVLEAMAAGVPVLATAVGGVPEIITNGVNGILVPPRRPEELTAGLLKLAGDSAWRGELSKRARETLSERFSFRLQTETLVDIYHRVLDN